jgi:small conductance mechanosensitive channel
VDDFTDSAVSIKIVGETIPNRQFMVTGELRKRIKEAFDEHGIQMPVIQHIVRSVSSNAKDESGQ